MVKRIFLCAAAVVLFTGSPAMADEPAAGLNGGSSVEYRPKLGGYVESWYRNDSSDLSDQTTASKKAGSEFRVRRARITVSGNLNTELEYKVTAALDGPAPGSQASVKLWDAYASYRVNDYFKVTAGQFKYDFTIEGSEGTPERVPVLRAESINDIAGKLGTTGGSFRDIGVRVSGAAKDLYGLTYGVSMINGSGMNTTDNNAEKDIVGGVTIRPVEGLLLAASAYTGRGQDETIGFTVRETAWSLGAEYAAFGVALRGEYLAGKWENWDAATSAALPGRTQKPSAWYLQASYKLPPAPSLEVMGRYEDYERDSNTPDSRLKTTTVGATWRIKDKTRVSVNYLIRDAGSSTVVKAQETDAAGSKIGNLLLLQAILVF